MDAASSRSHRPAVAGTAAALVLVHLAALYAPSVGIEGPVTWTDKVVHLLLFAAPTYAVGLALRSVAPAVVAFALHAPVSELVQYAFLPHRSGDVWDAVLDLVGVSVGAGLLMVRRRRPDW